MLPAGISILDRFQLAHDCGFEAIECPTEPDRSRAEEMLAASRKSRLPIHSVMNQEHWRSPLSSPDPAVVEKSIEGMRSSLHNAKLWGAGTVLLVPAVVTAEVTYAQAWERSQRVIRGLVVDAERMRENLGLTHGALFSQRLLLALVAQGATRDDAYRIVQRLAQEALDTRVHLRTLLAADAAGEGLDLDAIFDFAPYVRHTDEIVGRLDTIA